MVQSYLHDTAFSPTAITTKLHCEHLMDNHSMLTKRLLSHRQTFEERQTGGFTRIS